ncbi:MAG: membrane protein insertase YidC [Chloroflexi bacterium]|nr:membrane protein insertase YidC [Chloroflexota bacterium]
MPWIARLGLSDGNPRLSGGTALGLTEAWNLLFLEPMLNFLLLLYRVLFHNFGIAIIVFTVVIRALTLPLTLQQLRASKAMAALQPKMKELQNKYAKEKEKLSGETMKLYKEHGVNPLGCALPTIVQFPIWIGLYQSIIQAMAERPEGLLSLSQHLYPGLTQFYQVVPLNNRFLWLNLAQPDPTLILPILVAASMWVQQRMMTMPSMDPQQAQMNKMMQVMMPVMFGFFTLQFASGLAVYWVIFNIISIGIQYLVTGWGGLVRPATPRAVPPASGGSTKGGKADAKRRKKR